MAGVVPTAGATGQAVRQRLVRGAAQRERGTAAARVTWFAPGGEHPGG